LGGRGGHKGGKVQHELIKNYGTGEKGLDFRESKEGEKKGNTRSMFVLALGGEYGW